MRTLGLIMELAAAAVAVQQAHDYTEARRAMVSRQIVSSAARAAA